MQLYKNGMRARKERKQRENEARLKKKKVERGTKFTTKEIL